MAKTSDTDRLKALDERAKRIESQRKVIAARAEYKKALAAIKK